MDSRLFQFQALTGILVLWYSGQPLVASSGPGSQYQDSLRTSTDGADMAPSRSHLSAEFIEDTYLHFSLEHLLTNYYDFTTYQLETTGEFSNPDPYTFSMSGNSHKWNHYSMDDQRIDDVFFPGSSLHKIILFDTELNLDVVSSEVRFSTESDKEDRLYVNWNQGNLGGRIPFADQYINFFHGHNSSYQNAYQPIEYRSKTADNGMFYFSKKLDKYRQSGYFNFGRRYHTGFGPRGIDDYYPEDYRQIYLDGRLELGGGIKELGYLLTYSNRENLFSEFNYDKEETAELDQLNTTIFVKGESYTTGINVGYKRINQIKPGFSRNIIDQDGEGLEPWYPSSSVVQLTLNHNQTGVVTAVDPGLKYNINLSNSLVHLNPSYDTITNSIYMQDLHGPFRALEVMDWHANAFSSGLLENSAGLSYSPSTGNRAGVVFSADLTFDGFLLEEKSFTSPNYQLDLNGYFKPVDRLRIGLNLGRRRIPFHYDYIRFFSNDYLSGKSFFWNDLNQDEIYQPKEKGDLLATTGGEFHDLSTQLRQPTMNFVDLTVDADLGNNWGLFWTGQYRSYRNLWSVEYSQPVEELGYFVDAGNDRHIFFLNGGEELKFVAKPLNSHVMEAAVEREISSLWDYPYYFASVIKIQKEGRLFFSASFSAHMTVGMGAFGNGVLHNDLDVLSESTASPNTQINRLGRLDSDRAYVLRSLVGYKISQRFSMSVQLKYRDGQPSSLHVPTISENEKGSQVGLWNVSTKGINPYTGEFGAREPGFWNYELRARYSPAILENRMSLSLYVYNILDVGTTLNYYNFSPGAAHDPFALDIQIPRGFILGLNFSI